MTRDHQARPRGQNQSRVNTIDPLDRDRVSRLKEIVGVVPLSEKMCLEGSTIKREMRDLGVSGFSLLDGLVLASARPIGRIS